MRPTPTTTPTRASSGGAGVAAAAISSLNREMANTEAMWIEMVVSVMVLITIAVDHQIRTIVGAIIRIVRTVPS